MITCPNCGSPNPEGAKFCAECAAPLAGVARPAESRRTVTVLFADVSGSTSIGEQLDPESLRALMGRYFAAMQGIIERHGGTVEKFIGDAVMAVFGIPTLHEDDALRAVRAAAEIGERLAGLNAELEAQRGIAIRFRTGVNTGEVVAGDPASGQTLVTGDAVNTAARMEQVAAAGQIVIGELTYRLVRDAVTVEALEPLSLKGKARPLLAYRLLGVTPGASGHARRLDAPLVGREVELAALQAAFGEAVAQRRCRLLTLLGTAGVGKSRLLAEFAAALAGQATVLTGRCLPYGEGISYWPLAEVLRTAAGIAEGDDRSAASAKLRELAATTPEAEVVAERLAQAIGLSSGSAPAEEIFWAARKLLETLARAQPLVIEFDDIQWADEAFLDLLEHILSLAHDAPLLLVCLARPELVERRPGWGSGWEGASSLRLEPLGQAGAAALIEQLPGGAELPAPLRQRILAAAEGNPLFVEEMLAMLLEEPERSPSELAAVPVPPTISALLAARLDQLAPGERGVAERASVVGQVFEQAALVELSPAGGSGALARDLLALVRKELIRPDRSELSAGDAYRFRHLLIRDAAYAALPKVERAELHARFADWLERVSGDRAEEYEEIIGYHWEQAHRYRTELGLVDETTAALAERAAERLTAAGRRALNTTGTASTIGLLERALVLRPAPSAARAETLVGLGDALTHAGRLDEAQARFQEALTWAQARGESVLEAIARVALARVLHGLDPEAMFGVQDAAVVPAAAVLDAAGQHREAAQAYGFLATLHADRGAMDESLRFNEMAIGQARLTQDRHLLAQVLATRAFTWTNGPGPAAVVTDALEALLPEVAASGLARAGVLVGLIELYAMTGRFEDARAAAALSRSILLEMGRPLVAAATSIHSGPMERLAGNLEAAEAELRTDYGTLKRANELGYRSTTVGYLAHVLLDRGSLEEALTLIDEAERISAEDDYVSHVVWRSARARALAGRNSRAAQEFAEDAVSRAKAAVVPVDLGCALLCLADVHQAARRWPEAIRAVEEAISVFQGKGATAYVEQAQARRAGLRRQGVSGRE